MAQRRVLDVSGLPDVAFGPKAPLWIGQFGMAVIESTLLLMLVAAYFYYRLHFESWPPPGNATPSAYLPTVNVILLVVSCLPMYLADKATLRKDWTLAIIGTVVSLLIGWIYFAIRLIEFKGLNYGWDSNLYGSLVWLILGIHTTHVIAAQVETTALLALVLMGKRDDRVRQGLNVDEIYWYFVVGSGVLIYFLVFLAPWVV